MVGGGHGACNIMRRDSDRSGTNMRNHTASRRNSIRSTAPSSTHLQRDGRLSNVELAQRVHLSPSACLRRVKQLEESGVIAQYVALLNPKAVGRHGTSFTIINLESMNNQQLEAFEQAVRDAPEILDCFYVAGSNDYLLRFAYRDAEDLERFHTEVLMRLPGVARSNSMLVLRTVKKTTALAL